MIVGSASLAGKVALVTGASRGIGAAVSRALSAAGAQVGMASRSGDNLGMPNAMARPCDVRRPDALEGFVREVVGRWGRLDILIINAGVGAYGPLLSIKLEDVEEMIDVNVRGMIHSVRAALPHLIAAGEADIVNVASEAGRRAYRDEAVYDASKFAQIGFIRSLDLEVRERGVRCTNLCPGSVATDFAMGRGRTPAMPELKDMMRPEDVAEVVMFALTRPRNHRILETAFSPMNEASS